MRCSLSSSTTTASIDRPVWNLISSSACRLVGSETATNSRLPRLTSGSTRCLASSLSETSLTVSRSGWMASRSSSGTPNSCEAAMAISRAFARPFATRCDTRLVLASLAAAIACCMDFSSSKPSWIRRSGRPCRAMRCALTAGMTLSAMDFCGCSARMRRYYYRRRRSASNCQITWNSAAQAACMLAGTASHLPGPRSPAKREKPLRRGASPDRQAAIAYADYGTAGLGSVLRLDVASVPTAAVPPAACRAALVGTRRRPSRCCRHCQRPTRRSSLMNGVSDQRLAADLRIGVGAP